MSEALLQLRELRTWFETDQGVARAVDGVSLDVHEGETVGLVGESGCGKSVTALSVMGLLPSLVRDIRPGSSIRFRGEELVAAPRRRLRELRGNEISMIFQEPMTSLNPVQRIGRQVVEPLRWHRKVGRADARAAGVTLLREVGLGDPEREFDAYPHELSGGMRQRAMIAMALACEPALLIADEPTTALDVTIQAQILELLAGLRKRLGMSLLLITHDLGVVAEVCDRVVVMYAGQVVEQGTVEEIFRHPVHPYTRGLLDSLPRLTGPRAPLTPIPGAVPAATAWPEGCRFRPRCPHAWERCAVEPPPLLDVASDDSSGQRARCWLVEEPARRGEHRGAEAGAGDA